MKTKEEYIEALERMKLSYYNLEGCMSAMNKYKEDVNLLKGLVNEHFEEKVETNFEHYKYEILEYFQDSLAVVKGKPKLCYKTNCNDCDFKINQEGCRKKVKEWLNQPYKKTKYKFTQFEKELLQCYPDTNSFKLFNSLNGMKEKGYFKGVDENIPIHEILDNCEVVG